MSAHYDTIVPSVDLSGSIHLLREEDRMAQFALSEQRIANRTITPDGRELPPTYRAWREERED